MLGASEGIWYMVMMLGASEGIWDMVMLGASSLDWWNWYWKAVVCEEPW